MKIDLDEQEAQAILNALEGSGALKGPLVFEHVMRLKAKVEKALRQCQTCNGLGYVTYDAEFDPYTVRCPKCGDVPRTAQLNK